MLQLLYGYPRFPALDDVINAGFKAIGLGEDIWASKAFICCSVGFMSKLFISICELLFRYEPCTSRCMSVKSGFVVGEARNCIGFWGSLFSSAINCCRSSDVDDKPNLLNGPFSVPMGSILRGSNSTKEKENIGLTKLNNTAKIQYCSINNLQTVNIKLKTLLHKAIFLATWNPIQE